MEVTSPFRSVVYIVGKLDNSSPYSAAYSAAIFKVEIGKNGEVIGDHTKPKDRIVDAFYRKKYFNSEPPPPPCFSNSEPHPPPCFSNVTCDMVGRNLYLIGSNSRMGHHGVTTQAPVHIFNTLTQQLTVLPECSSPIAPKSFPTAMAAGSKLYVYGQNMLTSLKVPQPTLECFNCKTLEWEVKLPIPPQFELPRSMFVEGYAVVNNFLVISVVDANGRCSRNEFLYWKFSGFNSSNKWEKLMVSEETRYYPFSGKAEFVDDVIYSYSNGCLVAYPVDFCDDGEGLLAISPPLEVGFPEFAESEIESYCFAYMGMGKRFCIVQTGVEDCIHDDQQHVAISVVEVSEDLSRLTTLTSTVCTLNMRGLHTELFHLNSCFVPSQLACPP